MKHLKNSVTIRIRRMTQPHRLIQGLRSQRGPTPRGPQRPQGPQWPQGQGPIQQEQRPTLVRPTLVRPTLVRPTLVRPQRPLLFAQHNITIELMGGLGNQLFQIWTLLALQKENPLFTIYFDAHPPTLGPRKKTYWHTDLLKVLAPQVGLAPPLPPIMVQEPHFHYAPIKLYSNSNSNSNSNNNTCYKLFGYYQSYKYFARHRTTLLAELRIREVQDQYRLKLQAIGLDLRRTVALHFRIGDYAQNPAFHPLLPLSYYDQALSSLLKQAPTCNQVLYFCEEADAAVCAEKIQTLRRQRPDIGAHFTFHTSPSSFQEDWEQLILMSLCEHHIIANSSFSWWGAYLSNQNPSQQKQTFYPTQWLGPAISKSQDTKDLCLPEWQPIAAL